MSYELGYYNALVSVRHSDGSVAVSHGGIEMGQGLSTKVAQSCARELGVPLEKISVKATNNLVNPNALWTGASVTSELCCRVSFFFSFRNGFFFAEYKEDFFFNWLILEI